MQFVRSYSDVNVSLNTGHTAPYTAKLEELATYISPSRDYLSSDRLQMVSICIRGFPWK